MSNGMSISNPKANSSSIAAPEQAGAARIARGVRRMFAASGYSTASEMILPDGRRADLVALAPDGSIEIVEIKSSLADFRADRKWRFYLEFCDRLYFALDDRTPQHVVPDDAGLILADGFSATIVRASEMVPIAAARRKSIILRFARHAADRLHALQDPRWRDHEF